MAQAIGDELHLLTDCDHMDPFLQTQSPLFDTLARLCQMPPFLSLDGIAHHAGQTPREWSVEVRDFIIGVKMSIPVASVFGNKWMY